MNKYIPAILGIVLIALLAKAQSTPNGAAILDSGIVLDVTLKQLLLMWLPGAAVAIYLIYKNVERLLPVFVVALLIFIALTATGCAGVAESVIDPAGYTQRSTAQSDALRSQAEAQTAFAESQKALADSEAERSRSEARRAEADARASEAQAAADQASAEADARAAEAQANFATAATKAVKDAAAQNKGTLILAIIIIALMAAWMIHNNTKIVVAVTQQSAYRQPVMLPPAPHVQILGVPPDIQLIADRHELTPQFNGERWVLVDSDGNARFQQKLLQG